MNVKIINIIGETAVSRDAGLKVREIISRCLESSSKLNLDFSEVKFYASPFFNTSVAPFLENMKIEDLLKLVEFSNLSPVGKRLLNQVIHNAIAFYNKTEEEKSHIEKNIDEGLD